MSIIFMIISITLLSLGLERNLEHLIYTGGMLFIISFACLAYEIAEFYLNRCANKDNNQ